MGRWEINLTTGERKFIEFSPEEWAAILAQAEQFALEEAARPKIRTLEERVSALEQAAK